MKTVYENKLHAEFHASVADGKKKWMFHYRKSFPFSYINIHMFTKHFLQHLSLSKIFAFLFPITKENICVYETFSVSEIYLKQTSRLIYS